MKNKISTVVNIFLIIYGLALFLRISFMESAKRDGFDIFQWILGPILIIVLGYIAIRQIIRKEDSIN